MFGAILAFVLLGGSFLAPRIFHTSSAAMNPAAQRRAEEAQRQLAAYNEGVPRLLARQDAEALRNADADTLLARVSKDVEDQSSLISQTIERARQADRQSGMNGSIPNPVSGAELIRKGVADLQKLGNANDANLKAAIKAANEAASEGRSSLGVGQVLGMVKSVEATDHFAESRRVRTRLNDERVEAVAAATEWAVAKTNFDHFSGLSGKAADEALRGDMAEFEKLLTEGQTTLDELNRTLSDRKTALESTKAGLVAARSELARIEQTGFQPGNDSSFLSMKSSLESVSKRMAELQEQEQLLIAGGLKGARISDDEIATANFEGGEETLGIQELERRQQVAADRVARLARGKEAISKQIENVGAYGKSAEDEAKRLSAQLNEKQEQFNKIIARMAELNNAAAAKEDAALAAASAAVAAYGSSKSATQTFLSEISEQKNLDTDGRNERLRMISADQNLKRMAEYADAEANALLGRIYAERVLELEAYLETLDRLTKVIKGSTYDPTANKEMLATARNEAIAALGKAKSAYAGFTSDARTGWMSQIALAAVDLTAARVDKDKAAELHADAADNMRKATEKAGKSWLFNAHYQMLKDLIAPGAPTSAEAKPEGDAPKPEETPTP